MFVGIFSHSKQKKTHYPLGLHTHTPRSGEFGPKKGKKNDDVVMINITLRQWGIISKYPLKSYQSIIS
jgi:hypothetical protein